MQILVSGAANGIGAAIVASALCHRHTVVATDFNQPALAERWKDSPGMVCETLNASSAEDCNALIKRSGQAGHVIDDLVNMAGILRGGRTGGLLWQDVHSMPGARVTPKETIPSWSTPMKGYGSLAKIASVPTHMHRYSQMRQVWPTMREQLAPR